MHALALALALSGGMAVYADHPISGRGVLDVPQTAQVRHLVFGLSDGTWAVNDSVLVTTEEGAVTFTIRSASPTVLRKDN